MVLGTTCSLHHSTVLKRFSINLVWSSVDATPFPILISIVENTTSLWRIIFVKAKKFSDCHKIASLIASKWFEDCSCIKGWKLSKITTKDDIHTTERIVEIACNVAHSIMYLIKNVGAYHANFVDEYNTTECVSIRLYSFTSYSCVSSSGNCYLKSSMYGSTSYSYSCLPVEAHATYALVLVLCVCENLFKFFG